MGSEMCIRDSIMDDIFGHFVFGICQKNRVRVDHELFDDDAWRLAAVKPLKEMAREQLGTIGGGNHYVDILVDEQERVWIAVHFGSRGLGHKTATWFLDKGGAKDEMDVEPLVSPAMTMDAIAMMVMLSIESPLKVWLFRFWPFAVAPDRACERAGLPRYRRPPIC